MSDPEPESALDPAPEPASWRERITAATGVEWSPVRLAAVVALALGGVVAAWALLRPPPPPPPPELSLPRADSTVAAPATSSTLADVVVHAAGAVHAPGVYHLPPGSRVADLIAAAGGLAGDADGSTLNLAAALRDGERVYVTRIGEIPPAAPPPPSADGEAVPAGPVDLNRATASELEVLPGVGPATAAAIVAYRDENGGFVRVEQLLDVRGIGPAKYEQLRPLVTI